MLGLLRFPFPARRAEKRKKNGLALAYEIRYRSKTPKVQRPRVHLRVQQRLPLRWRSVEADLYRDSLAGGGAEVKGNER